MAEKQRGRKIGRNKSWCKAYSMGMRELINRKKRWRRTLKRQPTNNQLLIRYETEFGEYQLSL